jgi:hypothetical protein
VVLTSSGGIVGTGIGAGRVTVVGKEVVTVETAVEVAVVVALVVAVVVAVAVTVTVFGG